jgi:hypothetical protein
MTKPDGGVAIRAAKARPGRQSSDVVPTRRRDTLASAYWDAQIVNPFV